MKDNKVILKLAERNASQIVPDVNAGAALIDVRLHLSLFLIWVGNDLDKVYGLIGKDQSATLASGKGCNKQTDVVVLGYSMTEYDLLVVSTLLLQHGLKREVVTVVHIISTEVLCIALDGKTATLLLSHHTVIDRFVKVIVVVLKSELKEETLNPVGINLDSPLTQLLKRNTVSGARMKSFVFPLA